MIDIKEIKNSALFELKSNWKCPFFVTFIVLALLITSGVTYYQILQGMACLSPEIVPFCFLTLIAIQILIIFPVVFLNTIFYLDFILGEKTLNITKQNLFDFILKKGNYRRSIIVSLLVSVFTGLWSLLFFIPGIVKSYAYAMTYYIAKDNPNLSANECINASIKMMKGHKRDLFLLDLSFIGWYMLSILTLGIGFLWLLPYINTSRAIFYVELAEENQKR